MKIFYYTTTGNSLNVAKKIGGELLSIPQLFSSEQELYEDDCIGFVFPCYYGGCPDIIKELFRYKNFKANYFFAIITYAKLDGYTRNEFDRLCISNKIHLNYLNHLKMPSNAAMFFDMEKSISKFDYSKLDYRLNQIILDISNRKNKLKLSLLYNRIMSASSLLVYNKMKGKFDNKFIITSSCNGCGTCVDLCPIKNIEIKDNKPIFLHDCLICMSCMNNCPQNAIHLPKEKNSSRYRHPDITLEEIIDSNK